MFKHLLRFSFDTDVMHSIKKKMKQYLLVQKDVNTLLIQNPTFFTGSIQKHLTQQQQQTTDIPIGPIIKLHRGGRSRVHDTANNLPSRHRAHAPGGRPGPNRIPPVPRDPALPDNRVRHRRGPRDLQGPTGLPPGHGGPPRALLWRLRHHQGEVIRRCTV